jgi:meiotic recombination protein SPO11
MVDSPAAAPPTATVPPLHESSHNSCVAEVIETFVLAALLPPSSCSDQRLPTNNTMNDNGPSLTLRKCFVYTTLLSLLHGNTLSAVTATQRNVFYQILRRIPDQRAVNSAIVELAGLMNVPRSLLGVQAGFRGSIGGSCTMRCNSVDLRRVGSQGCPVPGHLVDPNDPLDSGGIDCSSARFLLIVEKDAVFQRLMAERIFDIVPCVIISGHGFPSLAVRALVKYIANIWRHLLIVALVDYNPAGILILLQYQQSTGGRTLKRGLREAADFAVSEVKWLGVHSADVPLNGPLKPFTQRCQAQIRNLVTPGSDGRKSNDCCDSSHHPTKEEGRQRRNRQSADQAYAVPPSWMNELLEMQRRAVTCEIEVLYPKQTVSISGGGAGAATFAQVVASKVLRQQYL